MTLLDACEPLFHRVCQLNALARSGGRTPDFPALRKEISELLQRTGDTMLSDPSLEKHWPHLELPLIFFVDSLISESALPAAGEWNQKRLAYDRTELAGDQKFFDLLDETLANPHPDATARLAVFYTCMGLGFVGWHLGQPEQLRTRMQEIIRRVDPGVRTEGHLKLCPEAYENVDTRELTEPPPIPGRILVALFAGLCLVFLAVQFFLHLEATRPLREAVNKILTHSREDHVPFTLRID